MIGEDDIQAPGALPEPLMSIVHAAAAGKVLVPEFQRSFVWPRDAVEELIASILSRYFIGSLLVLDTPAHHPMFPCRLVEGLEQLGRQMAAAGTLRLLLDGQQRITSLVYAFYEPPIPLKQTTNAYRFYFQIAPALSGDLDSAIVGVSLGWSKGIKDKEDEVQRGESLRLSVLADTDAFSEWLYSTQTRWQGDDKKLIRAIQKRLANFMIPVVSLVPETGADNIVKIFERVNRTGIPLSLFDLAVARMYVKGVRDLHDRWNAFRESQPEAAELAGPEGVLRVIALLEDRPPQRSNLLRVLDDLDAQGFVERWTQATSALGQARLRVREVYGGYENRWVPYRTMLVPLAFMLHRAGEQRLPAIAFERLDKWYWTSVFGQRYEAATDTVTQQDATSVLSWMLGGPVPSSLSQTDARRANIDVEAPQSAIYRGVLSLCAVHGSRDLCSGQPISLNQCDDDHLFPKSVYREAHPVDNVLNHVLIERVCNELVKRALKPSVFLQKCLEGHGGDTDRLLATLASHLISSVGYRSLREDDFESFTNERRRSIREAIGARVIQTVDEGDASGEVRNPPSAG